MAGKRRGKENELRRRLLNSPHIIVIVVIQMRIVIRHMRVLVMPRVISIAVLVAMLTAPPVGLIAIVRIVVVVVHGRIVICAVPIMLL